MTQRNLPRRTSQRGFALAAVLWLLAGLSIVALVSEAALTAKQRIAQLRERTDFIQDAISARAELEYRLSASRPVTNGLTDGITLIKTDSSPYQVRAKSLVQLQDQGGLISLNVVSRPLLSAHLQKCGVPAESTETLLDALEDYTDADNLTRINGAERETYGSPYETPEYLFGEEFTLEQPWRVSRQWFLTHTWHVPRVCYIFWQPL